MSDISHDDFAHMLAQHLKCDDRMVWENIPAGSAGNVRPDVFTIQKSFANPNPITYEIKVSLSDFRSDVTKAKWKAYLKFSYGVVFAVPKGLITKNDLPNGCGLITYNGAGIWHTVKKPTLSPCRLDGDILLKLLIGGGKRMTQNKVIQPRQFDQYKHMEKLRSKFGKNIAENIQFIEEYPSMKKEINALKKQLGELLDVNPDRWCFERDIADKIQQIREQADESERKKAIAVRLDKLNKILSSQIDTIKREFTD